MDHYLHPTNHNAFTCKLQFIIIQIWGSYSAYIGQ